MVGWQQAEEKGGRPDEPGTAPDPGASIRVSFSFLVRFSVSELAPYHHPRTSPLSPFSFTSPFVAHAPIAVRPVVVSVDDRCCERCNLETDRRLGTRGRHAMHENGAAAAAAAWWLVR